MLHNSPSLDPYLALEPSVLSFYDSLDVRLPFFIILPHPRLEIEDQIEMIKFYEIEV